MAGEAADGNKVLAHCDRVNPDVVLMDLVMPEVVLALLVERLNNTQIATHLFVSPSTVKPHFSNLLSKLGVVSRPDVATLAMRLGLVT
jgi:DNA-binding NarL/FixJ family response regulator